MRKVLKVVLVVAMLSCFSFSFVYGRVRSTSATTTKKAPTSATTTKKAPTTAAKPVAASTQSAGKLGIGFYALSPVPGSLSVRYWSSDTLGFNFNFGFNSREAYGTDVRDILLGAKILAVLKEEKQLKAYVGGGLDLDFADYGETNTGYRLVFLSGVEYFFYGLPNLGFCAEIGLQVGEDAYEDSFVGTTYGNVGLHYYFK